MRPLPPQGSALPTAPHPDLSAFFADLDIIAQQNSFVNTFLQNIFKKRKRRGEVGRAMGCKRYSDLLGVKVERAVTEETAGTVGTDGKGASGELGASVIRIYRV